MSGKPIDEAVRALRELRETGDVSDWHAMERALDAGIAALTAAQQQGQAVDEMCAVCGNPKDSAMHSFADPYMEAQGMYHQCVPRTTPPSAPVGALGQQSGAVAVDVETLPEFLDRIARELVERDTHRDTFAAGIASSLRGRALVLRAAQPNTFYDKE